MLHRTITSRYRRRRGATRHIAAASVLSCSSEGRRDDDWPQNVVVFDLRPDALMLGSFAIAAAVAGPADMTPINAMRLNKLLDAS